VFSSAVLTIMVADMDRAVRFYTETLGAEMRFRAGNEWAEVVLAGLAVGLHPAGSHSSTGPTGGLSVGLQVADMQAAIAALQARGVDFPNGAVPSGNLVLAHFSDPDGTPMYLFAYGGQQG
jgi:predicted enzyme related to lactoylglutathione lyase